MQVKNLYSYNIVVSLLIVCCTYQYQHSSSLLYQLDNTENSVHQNKLFSNHSYSQDNFDGLNNKNTDTSNIIATQQNTEAIQIYTKAQNLYDNEKIICKTHYNADDTEERMYYNTLRKLLYTQLIDTNQNLLQEEFFDDHNKITQKIYHPDHSQTISEYTARREPLTKKYVDNDGNLTRKKIYKKNGDIITIKNNKNSTQSIAYARANRTIAYTKLVDKNGQTLEKNIHKNYGRKMIIHHNPDLTKKIEYVNKNHACKKESYINQQGEKMDASMELITAWHEAGHALVIMLRQSLLQINTISIIPGLDTAGNRIHGSVKTINEHNRKKSHKELVAMMEICLAGAVAEQMLFKKPRLNPHNHIIRYLQDLRYKTDMQRFMNNINELLTRKRTMQNHKNTIENPAHKKEMIVKTYYKDYTFLQNHRTELRILAEELMNKKILTGHEACALLQKHNQLNTTK